MQSHVSAVPASEAGGQVDVPDQDDAAFPQGRPLHRDGTVCRKGPIFGIAGWTGPVYDLRGNLIGRVSECDCDWFLVGHDAPVSSA